MEREALLGREDAVVKALFGYAQAAVPVARMRIPRLQVPSETETGGTESFSYRLHGVKQEQLDAANREATTRVRDEEAPGFQFKDRVNTAEAQARLVYVATHPEDKRRYWDNLELQRRYNAGTPWDLIAHLHLAGELSRAFMTIFELSGFVGQSAQTEKTVRD
jgi:hypothetical protein